MCVMLAVAVHLDALRPAIADQLHHRARPSVGGTSITRYSIGSIVWPLISLVMTRGLPTDSS